MEHGLGVENLGLIEQWLKCLNPCSNGTWSRRHNLSEYKGYRIVLILVLMEHGLGVWKLSLME